MGVRPPLRLKTELTMLLDAPNRNLRAVGRAGGRRVRRTAFGRSAFRARRTSRICVRASSDCDATSATLVTCAVCEKRITPLCDADDLLDDGSAVADRRDVSANIEVGMRGARGLQEVGALDALRNGRHVDAAGGDHLLCENLRDGGADARIGARLHVKRDRPARPASARSPAGAAGRARASASGDGATATVASASNEQTTASPRRRRGEILQTSRLVPSRWPCGCPVDHAMLYSAPKRKIEPMQ